MLREPSLDRGGRGSEAGGIGDKSVSIEPRNHPPDHGVTGCISPAHAGTNLVSCACSPSHLQNAKRAEWFCRVRAVHGRCDLLCESQMREMSKDEKGVAEVMRKIAI